MGFDTFGHREALEVQLESVLPHKRAGFIDSALAQNSFTSDDLVSLINLYIPDSKRGKAQRESLMNRIYRQLHMQNHLDQNLSVEKPSIPEEMMSQIRNACRTVVGPRVVFYDDEGSRRSYAMEKTFNPYA